MKYSPGMFCRVREATLPALTSEESEERGEDGRLDKRGGEEPVPSERGSSVNGSNDDFVPFVAQERDEPLQCPWVVADLDTLYIQSPIGPAVLSNHIQLPDRSPGPVLCSDFPREVVC